MGYQHCIVSWKLQSSWGFSDPITERNDCTIHSKTIDPQGRYITAERHDATKRCDTSRRFLASCASAVPRLLAVFCRCDMSHEFKPA